MALISFRPVTDPNDAQDCLICWDSSNDKPKVVHEAPTSQEDQKVQHCFHKECLDGWLTLPTHPNSCPNCRKAIDLTSLFSPEEIRSFTEQKIKRGIEFATFLNTKMLQNSILISIASYATILALGLTQDKIGDKIEGLISSLGIFFVTGTLAQLSARDVVNNFPPFDVTSGRVCAIIGGLSSLFHFIDPLSLRPYLSKLSLQSATQYLVDPNTIGQLTPFVTPLAYVAIAFGIGRLIESKFSCIGLNPDGSFQIYLSYPRLRRRTLGLAILPFVAYQIGINAKQYFYP